MAVYAADPVGARTGAQMWTRLFRWFLLLLAVVVLILGITLLAVFVGRLSVDQRLAAVVVRVSRMVMAVLASLVMLAGVGLFWRTLSRLRVVSGASPSGLLLGAAVAAVLFRTGVYALVVWPLWYVIGAMKPWGLRPHLQQAASAASARQARSFFTS
jgi:hypothetical protein